ncbi:unnamed protein product [Rhizophagus irregularis]|nr:unnamed protein product [Rhizophagus irregularis]
MLDSVPEELSASLEPPAHVKEQDEPIDSFSDCYLSDKEPDQEEGPPTKESILEANDDYNVLDDMLSDSDSTTVDPVSKQQPESPAESSAKSESFTNPKFSMEFVVEPVSEKQPILEPDTKPEVDWDSEPKEGTQAHWA